jgi:dTMP kinase
VTGRGRLIAVEGIDGSGKTTQARLLAETLGAQLTAEPGATPLGRALRRLVLDPDLPPVSARAEALLLAADRAEHVATVIAPALARGRWVVTDRFSASTLAYQGYGRGLELAELRSLVEWAARGVEPDMTVVLDLPVAVAHARFHAARPDRLEGLDSDFHERVRAGYLSLAAEQPERWMVVDGTGELDAVAAQIRDAVEDRLGSPPLPAGTGQ